MEKTYIVNIDLKKSRMAVVLSHTVDFRTRHITRTENYIMIKVVSSQEDVTILNMCPPNKIALKYRKQKLMKLKVKTDKPIIRVRDFSTPLSVIDGTRTDTKY